MKDNLRYIVAGAACGAIVGAIAGLLYTRYAEKPGAGLSGAVERTTAVADRGKLMRLGWGVVALIRQIIELGE